MSINLVLAGEQKPVSSNAAKSSVTPRKLLDETARGVHGDQDKFAESHLPPVTAHTQFPS